MSNYKVPSIPLVLAPKRLQEAQAQAKKSALARHTAVQAKASPKASSLASVMSAPAPDEVLPEEVPGNLERAKLYSKAASSLPQGTSVDFAATEPASDSQLKRMLSASGIPTDPGKAPRVSDSFANPVKDEEAKTSSLRDFFLQSKAPTESVNLKGIAHLAQMLNPDHKVNYSYEPTKDDALENGVALTKQLEDSKRKDQETNLKLLQQLNGIDGTKSQVSLTRKEPNPFSKGLAQDNQFRMKYAGELLKVGKEFDERLNGLSGFKKALDSGDPQQISSMLSLLVRNNGEKGVLTDNDISRTHSKTLGESLASVERWLSGGIHTVDPEVNASLQEIYKNANDRMLKETRDKTQSLQDAYSVDPRYREEEQGESTSRLRARIEGAKPQKSKLEESMSPEATSQFIDEFLAKKRAKK